MPKFGILAFLVTSVLRFPILSFYPQSFSLPECCLQSFIQPKFYSNINKSCDRCKYDLQLIVIFCLKFQVAHMKQVIDSFLRDIAIYCAVTFIGVIIDKQTRGYKGVQLKLILSGLIDPFLQFKNRLVFQSFMVIFKYLMIAGDSL